MILRRSWKEEFYKMAYEKNKKTFYLDEVIRFLESMKDRDYRTHSTVRKSILDFLEDRMNQDILGYTNQNEQRKN